LSREDVDTYEVELRFKQPSDEAGPESVRGIVHLDFAELRKRRFNPEHYGEYLSQSLFGDPNVKEAFKNAWEASQRLQAILRVRLLIDRSAPELHNLHWETLRDLERNNWFLANESFVFSRYLLSYDRRPIRVRSWGNLRT
jgi:hypothetical protein